MPEYTSKVIANGRTIMDLTGDTVDAAHLLSGYTAHGADGAPVTGGCTYDADTSDATATADEILATRTAYKAGNKITGSMTNNGAVAGTISTVAGQYTVPQGYHDGSGKVGIDATEQAKIIAGNIKSGVTILGVTGTYSGSSVTAQSKSAAPSFSAQTILPDQGYDYLSQVDISAITVTYTPNAAGGNTCTIGPSS